MSVDFQDNYKVKITSKNMKEPCTVDVSDRKQDYISEEIYKNGKLVEPRKGWVDGFNVVDPVDVDHDGNLELVAYQYIAGIAHYDMVGQMVSTFKYNAKTSKWHLLSLKYQKP